MEVHNVCRCGESWTIEGELGETHYCPYCGKPHSKNRLISHETESWLVMGAMAALTLLFMFFAEPFAAMGWALATAFAYGWWQAEPG